MTKLERIQSNYTFENLYNVICDNGEKIAAEYMVENEIQKMSYHNFQNITEKLAGKLQKLLGVENLGKYVGIHLDNCPEWMCIFWGLLRAGFHPISLDFRASRENLLHLLKHSGAIAILTNETEIISPNVQQILKSTLLEDLDSAPSLQKEQWGIYFAICTSGTTDSSKVFVYHARALMSNIVCSWSTYENSRFLMLPDAKILAFLPLYHIFGLLAMGIFPMMYGLTLVYMKDRSPLTFVDTCKRHKITEIYAVPLLWNNLFAKLQNKIRQEPWWKRMIFRSLQGVSICIQFFAPEWGSKFVREHFFRSLHNQFLGVNLRSFLSGGAYLSPQTTHFFISIGISMACGYGMTEAGIVSAEASSNFLLRWNNSLGGIFSSLETKIVPVKDFKNKEVGELYFRGDSLYTARLVHGELIPREKDVDSEGWYAIGDLAIIRHGSLYLQGRIKDTIIKSSGENIYPDELEEAFRTVENIEEMCVLGLQDEKGKESVVLVIYLGVDPTTEFIDQVSMRIYERNLKLPLYKRLDLILVSHQGLPKTSSMKPQRQVLKKALESKTWEVTPISLHTIVNKIPKVKAKKQDDINQEVKEGVRSIFAEVLGMSVQDVSDEAHFVEELGGDSLQAIELAALLEKKYQVFISDATLLECNNVTEITDVILKQLKQQPNPDSWRIIKNKVKRQPISSFDKIRELQYFHRQKEMAGEYNPYFVHHDSVIRDTSLVDNKVVINLGSYNYLGLSGDPRTIKAAQDAIAQYGTSASGSRLLTGEKTLYRELEKELAEWKCLEDAIVLVSGHATNVTFVGNFCNENDLIIYDALSHNSIEQGCRLAKCESKAFPHNDFHTLDSILAQNRNYYEKVLIIIEGVYSMDGDIAPVPEFVALKKKYGAFLMVDEAHSACVLGEYGRGVDEYFNLEPDDIDIRMGTLSKGLGTCGGYLAGKKDFIEYLRYSLPGFVFSVGINPGSAAATLEALRILKKDNSMVQRLHKNIDVFLEEAHKRNFHTCLAQKTAIIPILVGSDESAFILSKLLQTKGVFVPPAVYPAVPKGKSRLRFCITSEHKLEQLIYALDALQELAQEHQIQLPSYTQTIAS